MDCPSVPGPISGPAVRPVHHMRVLLISLNPSVLQLTTRTLALTFAASRTCRAARIRMAAITMQDSISTTVRAITPATNGWPRTAPVHAKEQRALATETPNMTSLKLVTNVGSDKIYKPRFIKMGIPLLRQRQAPHGRRRREEPMYIAGEGGHFYNAFVALDERNVCPSGYVAPSNGAFEALSAYIQTQGWDHQALKAQSGWNGAVGTNESGFTALSAGYIASSSWNFQNSNELLGIGRQHNILRVVIIICMCPVRTILSSGTVRIMAIACAA